MNMLADNPLWPRPAAESGFWSSSSCSWEFGNRNLASPKADNLVIPELSKDAYVDGYPSLSLSATAGDHPNLYQTKRLGGLWNHLTGVLSHIRTVCGQLWTKVSQMATNITSDGVKFWVSRMPSWKNVQQIHY
ncbi:unnamed protein product [Sphagnum jensenii]